MLVFLHLEVVLEQLRRGPLERNGSALLAARNELLVVLIEAVRPTAGVHIVRDATDRGGEALFPGPALIRNLLLQFAVAALSVARAGVLAAAVLLRDSQLGSLRIFSWLSQAERSE